jgi:long-subunit acyl-CoA synthetase (AMP-forming)
MAIQQQNPGIRKWLVTKAHRLGLRNGYAQQRRHRKPLFFGLARRLVLRKIREQLGLDRARLCVSSAAPIALSTLEFFLRLDIPILEIYGMSECTGPATFSTPRHYRTGKSGIPLPGTEVRIAEDGEILIRGPHVFLGYYKNEEATHAALDEEGWLYSGDIGTLDAKGFLTVTDRKKELIITSSGQNVAPQLLEIKLKTIPGVAQAVVMGDSRNYLAALLVLDPAQIPYVARLAGSRAQYVEEAIQCPYFKAHLQQQVIALNREVLRQEIIQRIALLPNEFTVAGGELTPTHKLKRQVIYQKYTAVIAELYR